MKPVDLAKKLRREAAFEPAVLDRGKAALMATIRQEVQPMRRPTIIPRLPYENVGAALSFLERAFGFREVPAARGVRADGAVDYTMVEFGDGMIGLGAQGAHGAFSPKRAGTATQYITVHVDDIDAHHQRALASGARDREPVARSLAGLSRLRGARPRGPPLALPPVAARGATVERR